MPQMAPINWLMLFFMFIMIFLLFNIMNYYMFIPMSNKSNNLINKKIISMNWKW